MSEIFYFEVEHSKLYEPNFGDYLGVNIRIVTNFRIINRLSRASPGRLVSHLGALEWPLDQQTQQFRNFREREGGGGEGGIHQKYGLRCISTLTTTTNRYSETLCDNSEGVQIAKLFQYKTHLVACSTNAEDARKVLDTTSPMNDVLNDQLILNLAIFVLTTRYRYM